HHDAMRRDETPRHAADGFHRRRREICRNGPDMHTAARCLHILVVDDEPLIRWSISETLGAAGHQVSEAQDAASALQALADVSEPDLVLLDFRLPDSSDLGLLAQIRQIAPAPTAGALKLGASRVLNKPFNMHDLEDIVRSL